MRRTLAFVVVVLAAFPLGATAKVEAYHSSIRPLTSSMQAQIRRAGFWHQGCPVSLSDLLVLRVVFVGSDGQAHTGQLVVNRDVASPLANVFARLYELRFPIRHMRFSDMYGPASGRPKDGDVTGSFDCRQAVPSPCTGGTGTGHWSNHAYGHAVDLDPVENPYVGCGMTRDPSAKPYLNRSRLRPGMVTPAVVAAFASIGWGWGGSWSGSTKDYMHFSIDGH